MILKSIGILQKHFKKILVSNNSLSCWYFLFHHTSLMYQRKKKNSFVTLHIKIFIVPDMIQGQWLSYCIPPLQNAYKCQYSDQMVHLELKNVWSGGGFMNQLIVLQHLPTWNELKLVHGQFFPGFCSTTT